MTKQALIGELAKTVRATISLTEAVLVGGEEKVDLGHLEGYPSPVRTVEWVVKTSGKGKSSAVIKAVSEKGGTDTRKIELMK